MIQYRKSEPAKRRRVKRDLIHTPSKGIAGLKLDGKQESSSEQPGTSKEILDCPLSDSFRQLTVEDDGEQS